MLVERLKTILRGTLASLPWLMLLAAPALADSGPRLTMGMRDASLNEVMEMLARQYRINILLADDVDAEVSFSLYDVNVDDAVRSIASAAGYMVEKRQQTYFILPEDQAGKTPNSNFTIVRAMPIRYTDAAELETKLSDYLSDFGNITALPDRGMLMVEDQPGYVYRIATLIEELDRRPQQVLIEAKLLEISLSDEESFGIDWQSFFSLANGEANAGLQGVGNPGTSGDTGFFFNILDSDYEVAIRALERDGRVRNLASPKVVTLENKEAEVIIGDRQGYSVTTTINQVTSETVEFLESGVILRVTPTVDENGEILLTIHPEVSNGIVDENGLPSQTTTELTTQFLVPSGRSIFIGGLMRHSMTEAEAGIPILGKIPGLRWAFGSRSRTNQNTETVVVITPRLLDDTFAAMNERSISVIEEAEQDMLDNSAVIEGYVEEAFPLLPNRKPPARDDTPATPTSGPMKTEAETQIEVAKPVTTREADIGPPQPVSSVAPAPATVGPPRAEPAGPPANPELPSNEKLATGPPDVDVPAVVEPEGQAEAGEPEVAPTESDTAEVVTTAEATIEDAVTEATETTAELGDVAEVNQVIEAAEPAAVSETSAVADADSTAPAEVIEETPAKPAEIVGRYALNLHSDPAPIELLPELGSDEQARLVYVTETEVDGATWYRLRLGFFATKAEAEEQLANWQQDYPNAWLVRVGPREHAKATEPQALAAAAN